MTYESITFALFSQGQAVDSEHMSEYTEDESDTPVGGQLTGFLRLDMLYLRPFLIRRVTHQEVSYFCGICLEYYRK